MTNLLDSVGTYTVKGSGVRQIQSGQQEATRSKQGELLHCTARLSPQKVVLTGKKLNQLVGHIIKRLVSHNTYF